MHPCYARDGQTRRYPPRLRVTIDRTAATALAMRPWGFDATRALAAAWAERWAEEPPARVAVLVAGLAAWKVRVARWRR